MEESANGYIMPIKEAVHSLKREGHPDQDDSSVPPARKTASGKCPQNTLC
jgi:hypothetical protein